MNIKKKINDGVLVNVMRITRKYNGLNKKKNNVIVSIQKDKNKEHEKRGRSKKV